MPKTAYLCLWCTLIISLSGPDLVIPGTDLVIRFFSSFCTATYAHLLLLTPPPTSSLTVFRATHSCPSIALQSVLDVVYPFVKAIACHNTLYGVQHVNSRLLPSPMVYLTQFHAIIILPLPLSDATVVSTLMICLTTQTILIVLFLL